MELRKYGFSLIALTMALLLITAAGCAGQTQVKPPTPTPQQITVNIAALRGPTALSMLQMMESHPSLGAGVTSNFQIVESPDVLTSKLVSKEVDIAALPTNMAAALYNKGVPYQLAAMSSWGVMYVVSNGVSVDKWQDLKGKTVYVVGKGATPDVVFRFLLSKNGLNPDTDVKLDYTLDQVQAAQSLIAGRINLAVLPEPWVTQALKGNEACLVVFDLQEEWKKIIGQNVALAQTCLVIKKDLAEKHPDIVKAFLSAYKESINWVNQNPDEAGKLAEKLGVGMKAPVAEAAIPRCNLRYEDAQKSKPAIEAFLQVLYDFAPQSIGGKMPDNDFYYKE